MSDSEYEYEYEEETRYVVFDAGTSVTNQLLEKIGGCRIIGLEQGQPFLQIGDITFQGEIDETIGTHLIFQVEERKVETSGLLPLLSSIRADAEDTAPKQQKYTLKYDCQTENIIKFESVTLQRKREEGEQRDTGDEDGTLTVIL